MRGGSYSPLSPPPWLRHWMWTYLGMMPRLSTIQPRGEPEARPLFYHASKQIRAFHFVSRWTICYPRGGDAVVERVVAIILASRNLTSSLLIQFAPCVRFASSNPALTSGNHTVLLLFRPTVTLNPEPIRPFSGIVQRIIINERACNLSSGINQDVSRYRGAPCGYAPCLNGGTCFPVLSRFLCHCGPRHSGPLCEHSKYRTKIMLLSVLILRRCFSNFFVTEGPRNWM